MATTPIQKRFIGFESIQTGTLTDLVGASSKYNLRADSMIGRYLSTSLAFFQTACFSSARLVKHVALAALSVLGIFFAFGRDSLCKNLYKAAIDLFGIGIASIGTLYPYWGQSGAVRAILYLNRNALNHQIFPQHVLERYELENPLILGQFSEYHARGLALQMREGYKLEELHSLKNPQ